MNISINRLESCSNLTANFKIVSDFLEVTEDQLELLMDILSGNPYRIFKATSSINDEEKLGYSRTSPSQKRKSFSKHRTVCNSYLFLKSRILMLSKAFKWEKETLETFGSSWINCFELVFRGKNNLSNLADCLDIDPQFLKFLIVRRNLKGKL
jgi:hypothetical protein